MKMDYINISYDVMILDMIMVCFVNAYNEGLNSLKID